MVCLERTKLGSWKRLVFHGEIEGRYVSFLIGLVVRGPSSLDFARLPADVEAEDSYDPTIVSADRSSAAHLRLEAWRDRFRNTWGMRPAFWLNLTLSIGGTLTGSTTDSEHLHLQKYSVP